jgi:hypothetical protein
MSELATQSLEECVPLALNALRKLLEVAILRASRRATATGDFSWELSHSWMINNNSIHKPVPVF